MNKPDPRAAHRAAIAREAASMLDDSRYDAWRSRGRRRVLVVGAAASILFTIAACLHGNSIVTLLAILLSAGCWWLLRKVVRGFADLPDEFIDERIRAVRNEHYLYAYRILSALTVTLLFLMFLASDARQLQWQAGANDLHAVFWAVLLGSAMLPSMLLAWSQREM